MKNITVKSDFKGNIHLRDFEVRKFISDNETVRMNYQRDVMTLTPEELTSKCVYTSKDKYKSKIKGSPDYHLFGYKWIPDEIDY